MSGSNVTRRIGEYTATPADVAAIFNVAPKTVARWAASGRLTAVRTPGGHRRFHPDDIAQLVINAQHRTN